MIRRWSSWYVARFVKSLIRASRVFRSRLNSCICRQIASFWNRYGYEGCQHKSYVCTGQEPKDSAQEGRRDVERTHLQVVFPWHICIDVALRVAVDSGCSLLLERRCWFIMIMWRGPFSLLHLHKKSRRKRNRTIFDEGHQCHRPQRSRMSATDYYKYMKEKMKVMNEKTRNQGVEWWPICYCWSQRVKPKENLKTKNSGLGLGTALSLSKLVACDIVAALHSTSE